MTNEELKNKIVEIIISAIWKDAEADYDSTDETEACSIADALIAAGIGDVSETDRRAEVAERALKDVCINVIKDEEDDLAIEPRARVLYRAHMKNAEKELQENEE